MPEYFDILDKTTGEPTGKSELRNIVHRYGHLSSGENQLVCVVREIYEELGILMEFDLGIDDNNNAANCGDETNGQNQQQAQLLQELSRISLELYPPQSPIDNSHNSDTPELRNAVVLAQYLWNQHELQRNERIEKLKEITQNETLTLSDRYPPCEYKVKISTILNPMYYRNTTLYFCGKFLQDSFIVGKEYIDNEFAYIFFLKDKFYTHEQVKTGIGNLEEVCDKKKDEEANEGEKAQKCSHHIVQFLDDEVDSVIYTPIQHYLQLQQILTDETKALAAQTETPQSTSAPPLTKPLDRTLFDETRKTNGDELDVMDKDWLVPISTLDEYRRTVFDKMLEVANLAKDQ